MGTGLLSDFIKETIEDEQKIITYKWLSITKNIPMNEAKAILQDFVASGVSPGLTVYLCVIGYLNRGSQKTLAVKIVKSSEKDFALKDYENATSHVYGIQRTNTEAQLLYSCDYDVNKKFTIESRSLLAIKHDSVAIKPLKIIIKQIPLQSNSVNLDKKLSQPLNVNKKSGLSSFFSKQKVESQPTDASKDLDSGLNEVKKESQDSDELTTNVNDRNKKTEIKSSQRSNARINPIPTVKRKPASGKTVAAEKGKRKRAIVESSSSSSGEDEGEDCNLSQDLFDYSPDVRQDCHASKENSDSESPKGHLKEEPSHHADIKENQNSNCDVRVEKMEKVNTYVMEDDDEGFLVTERVAEMVKVPVEAAADAKGASRPGKKIDDSKSKTEVAKKAPAGKKKPAPLPAKQSMINNFFTRK